MNFENQIPVRKTADQKVQEKKILKDQNVRNTLSRVFDFSGDSQERFNCFNDELQRFADNHKGLVDEEVINQVSKDVKTFCGVEDKEDFIENCFLAIKPLMDWMEANKALIEAKRRKDFVENGNFIPLNESLSYGKTKDVIHIHVAPSETLSAGTQLVLLRDGLRNLRKIVENDETIKKITATSWIVATEQGKGIMEKLGFTVTGEISSEMREKFFKSDDRPVSEAIITRDEFLKNEGYK